MTQKDTHVAPIILTHVRWVIPPPPPGCQPTPRRHQPDPPPTLVFDRYLRGGAQRDRIQPPPWVSAMVLVSGQCPQKQSCTFLWRHCWCSQVSAGLRPTADELLQHVFFQKYQDDLNKHAKPLLENNRYVNRSACLRVAFSVRHHRNLLFAAHDVRRRRRCPCRSFFESCDMEGPSRLGAWGAAQRLQSKLLPFTAIRPFHNALQATHISILTTETNHRATTPRGGGKKVCWGGVQRKSPASTVQARAPPASIMKRTLPTTNKERALRTRDPQSGGAYVGDGQTARGGTGHLGLTHTRKSSEAGCGRPGDGGGWTAKTVKQPPQQPAQPQHANYWALLTRKRHIPPHPSQPRHTNHWAPRTRKRHRQEHRPQRPTESSDPTQHAKGRTGDCPGPRKGAATRRNVTQGVV